MYTIEKINTKYFVMNGDVKVSEGLKKDEAIELLEKLKSIVKFK